MLCLIASLFYSEEMYSQASDRVTTSPQKGDGAINILHRFDIPADEENLSMFQELNQGKFTKNGGLIIGRKYMLPITIYKYNGTSIRSTIGNPDWDNAVRIQKYNEAMHARGLKENDYRADNILWVPMLGIDGINEVSDAKTEQKPLKRKYPIFGKKYEWVDPIDNSLSGKIFYVVSGHGGPDPGAIGYQANYELHEEEYAYDVSLRLARRLLEHGAEVHIIVQDDDGIRDDRYLSFNDDEYYIGGIPIARNQLARLQKRAEIINGMYADNLSKTASQFVIITHIDSRITDKMIDIFFYHNENSKEGKAMAETLLETIENKYRIAQPGRGYEGSVSHRNLYMLRKTMPVSIYIELGNIQNDRDQRRIVEVNNRQAIANWLTDGIINHINSYKD